MANDDILVAKNTFWHSEAKVMIHKNKTRVRAGHPMLKGYEEHFKPIDVHFDVEQATARPGEKRGKKKSDDEKSDE